MTMISPYIYLPIISLLIGLTLAFLSLFKGKFKKENILFAVICLWYTLLAPAFIMHHLIQSEKIILTIERSIHFFYVFLPFVSMIFYHEILGTKRKWLEILLFIICAATAATTPTSLYFTGLYKYNWGYIAKGGIAFKIFGVFGISVLLYGIVLSLITLTREKNQKTRSKIKYILVSLNVIGVLTIFNIPAMQGKNIYPPGNFMFVPLCIMAYGILRYRLLDIKSILHITFIWLMISSIIILPNFLVFYFGRHYFSRFNTRELFALFITWILLDHLYFRTIQPMINQLFNRKKFNLIKIENNFIEDVSIIKKLSDFVSTLENTLKTTLAFRNLKIFMINSEKKYLTSNNEELSISIKLCEQIIQHMEIIGYQDIEAFTSNIELQNELRIFFEKNGANYLIPLIHTSTLLGIIAASERANLRDLNKGERHFVNSICSSVAIALENTLTYQELSDIKDELENKVNLRTKELTKKNNQLLFELKVAKNVQNNLLPKPLPSNTGIEIFSQLEIQKEVSSVFYDYFRIDESRMAVCFYEVLGSDIAAALLTSIVKTDIEAILKKKLTAATASLRLNQMLLPVLRNTGAKINFFLGIIDIITCKINYTTCGDIGFYLNRDEIRSLASVEFTSPINAIAPLSFPENTIDLQGNDYLYLVTRHFNLSSCLAEVPDFHKKELSAQQGVLNQQLKIRDSLCQDAAYMIIKLNMSFQNNSDLSKAADYYEHGEYLKAQALYNKQDTDKLPPLHQYIMSKIEFRMKNFYKALKLIESACEKAPTELEFSYYRALILMHEKNYQAALEILNKIITVDKNYKKTTELVSRIENINLGGDGLE